MANVQAMWPRYGRHRRSAWGTGGEPVGVKMLHLSDLHICRADVRQRLDKVCAAVGRTLPWLHGELQYAEDDRLELLRETIDRLDPDVICMSGDISAFGDVESLRAGGRYLDSLRARPVGPPRVLVSVPGNHDALEGQFRRLAGGEWKRVPWYMRLLAWRHVRPIRRAIESLPRAGMDGDGVLANYQVMAREWSEAHHARPFAGVIRDIPVVIVPFTTISGSPFWMNQGLASLEGCARYPELLRNIDHRQPAVRVAVMHHHPLSSPDVVEPRFVHAYNSMPGGSRMLREMQLHGTRLLLHGHQHQWNEYALDFLIPGREPLHILGAPGASFSRPCGFNWIEILPDHQVRITPHEYRDGVFEPRHAEHAAHLHMAAV